MCGSLMTCFIACCSLNTYFIKLVNSFYQSLVGFLFPSPEKRFLLFGPLCSRLSLCTQTLCKLVAERRWKKRGRGKKAPAANPTCLKSEEEVTNFNLIYHLPLVFCCTKTRKLFFYLSVLLRMHRITNIRAKIEFIFPKQLFKSSCTKIQQ